MSKKIRKIGLVILFFKDIIIDLFRPPYRFNMIIEHMYFIGNKSINILVIFSFFMGAIVSIQIGYILDSVNGSALIGGACGVLLVRSFGPLFNAFLISARVGSSISAELSYMKINEQIDAIECMGINPINYIVSPKIIALMIMTPILNSLFILINITSAYIIGNMLYEVDLPTFIDSFTNYIKIEDIIISINKSIIFAFLIGSISSYHGLTANLKSKNIGIATRKGVVYSLFSILLFDLIIYYFKYIKPAA